MIKKSALISKNFKSSFLSCEKDQETIWRKLFIESQPYSKKLIKLLTIGETDCLDETQAQYSEYIKKYDLRTLKQEGYIKDVPQLKLEEYNKYQSIILLEFTGFTPSSNAEFRNTILRFMILTPLDYWELDDYKIRPIQILGYIDGILNNSKLSGIGTLQFSNATEFVADGVWGGYSLEYIAVHGSEDKGEAAISDNMPAPY